MGTTGTIDVNLTTFGLSINESTGMASNVMAGIRDQGLLVGTAIGIVISVGLLFGIVFLVLSVIPKLLAKVKGLKSA